MTLIGLGMTWHTLRLNHAPFWRAQVPSMLIPGTASLRNARYTETGDTLDTLELPADEPTGTVS